jgi:hypothetical protein
MLDDADLDLPQEPAPEPPRRSGSRSFVVVAGILGGIMLLALVGLVVWTLVIRPQQLAAATEEPGLTSAQQTGTAIAHALQATSTASPTFTATSTRTPTPTRTPAPPTATNTPVTPLFSSTPGGPTAEPAGATQTVETLLTQAAMAQTAAVTGAPTETFTPTVTASALPQTGIADGPGGPGILIAMAALLLLVIIGARRLRNAE